MTRTCGSRRLPEPEQRRQGMVSAPGAMQHGQTFRQQFIDHALWQFGAGLKLVDDDAFDLQLRIVIGPNFPHVVEQGVECLA